MYCNVKGVKCCFQHPILADFCFSLKCLLILPAQRTMHSSTAGTCDKPQIQKPKQHTHINLNSGKQAHTHSSNRQQIHSYHSVQIQSHMHQYCNRSTQNNSISHQKTHICSVEVCLRNVMYIFPRIIITLMFLLDHYYFTGKKKSLTKEYKMSNSLTSPRYSVTL